MKVVYLAHPVSGDVEGNLKKARAWLRYFWKTRPGVAVIAPWITECEELDDSDLCEREAGLQRDVAVVQRCDELWLCGTLELSSGMYREACGALSSARGLKVFHYLAEYPSDDMRRVQYKRIHELPRKSR